MKTNINDLNLISTFTGISAIWREQPRANAEPSTYFGPFVYSIAKRSEDLKAIYRLRYDVYCVEKGWLDAADYPNKYEIDDYDRHSVYIIAQNIMGTIVGSLRLIISADHPLPIFNNFDIDAPLEKGRYMEISRLVTAKESRCFGLAVGLYQTLFQFAVTAGITHTLAVIEMPLLRMLRRLKYPFKFIGKPKDYFGALTIPVVAENSKVQAHTTCRIYHS